MPKLSELIAAEREAAARSHNVYWTDGAVAAQPHDDAYEQAKANVDAAVKAMETGDEADDCIDAEEARDLVEEQRRFYDTEES